MRHSSIAPERLLESFDLDQYPDEIAAALGLDPEVVDGVLCFAFVQDWSAAESSSLPSISTPLIDWKGCEYVEQVPGRMGGVPVVRHSRVAAETTVVGILLGETARELAYQFTLKLSEVRGVVAFAEKQMPLAKAG